MRRGQPISIFVDNAIEHTRDQIYCSVQNIEWHNAPLPKSFGDGDRFLQQKKAPRVRLNVMPPSPNHLLSRLLQTTPEAAQHLERVSLSPGSWPTEVEKEEEGHLYFPEAGLIGLYWQGTPLTNVRTAWLGCHACWWPGYWMGSSLKLQVLQAGHAQRIGWTVLQAEPQRYAPWLLQTAAVSQQLIHQMAQMVYCAQNHNTLQRLASSLLVMLHQNPHSGEHLSVGELAHWLSCPAGDVQLAAQTLQSQGALQMTSTPGTGVQVHSLQPQMLSTLACSCHLQVAQNDAASSAIQV